MKFNIQLIIKEEYQETELGLLPKEWNVSKIGDIFEIQQGKQLSAKESKEGKIKRPFLRTANVFWGNVDIPTLDYMYFTEKELEKLKLRANDILVCEGGDVGRTALWRGELADCLYQNHLYRLRPFHTNYFPIFFVYWMRFAILTKKMYIQSANRTTIPNLSSSRLKEFVIPVPQFPEQQNIAYVLSTMQKAQQSAERVINSLKELKKSLMKHLFTFGAVSFMDVDKIKLKEIENGKIPEVWEIVRLGQIAKLQDKVSVNSDNFVSFENIESGTGKILSVDDAKKYRTKTPFKQGTLLYGKIRPYLNKVWLANIDGFCTHDIIRIVTIRCDMLFLKYVLLSQKFVEFATSKSTGTKMPRVKWNSMETFTIGLPSIIEQQQIAYILSSVDEKIDIEEKRKIALVELFNSLLQNLMTAKIRVKDLEKDTK